MPTSPAKKWWDLLRAATLWFIWISRNGDVIPGATKVSSAAVKAKIWHQLKLQMQIEWAKHQTKVKDGRFMQHEAMRTFEFDFGESHIIYQIVEDKLSFEL